jgi:hypothetical protein
MHSPSFIERYLVWPLLDWRDRRRLRIFRSVLKQYGMDWGKYDLEEMTNMYHRHSHEIVMD